MLIHTYIYTTDKSQKQCLYHLDRLCVAHKGLKESGATQVRCNMMRNHFKLRPAPDMHMPDSPNVVDVHDSLWNRPVGPQTGVREEKRGALASFYRRGYIPRLNLSDPELI